VRALGQVPESESFQDGEYDAMDRRQPKSVGEDRLRQQPEESRNAEAAKVKDKLERSQIPAQRDRTPAQRTPQKDLALSDTSREVRGVCCSDQLNPPPKAFIRTELLQRARQPVPPFTSLVVALNDRSVAGQPSA